MSRLGVALALSAVVAVSAVGRAGVAAATPVAPADSCVVIDTDFDIDDMMSIPTVIGARHVAAIVTTEGYTLPTLGASAVERLVAEPGQRTIPVIVGAGIGRPESDIAATFGDYVLVYRGIMNRLNNFLPTGLAPAPVAGDYVQRIAAAVADCRRVDVLVLGAFTSFVNYSPAIRDKLGRVVITGRPLEGDPELEAGESFNCVYDRPACETAFHEQLPGLDHTFVDVPRTACDTTPNKAGCAGTVYGPTLAMARALGSEGLPNTLKQIMLNDSATWAIDTWEQSGYGGRSMFWDQSTVLALLDPADFHQVGAHVETALSPRDFQHKWTAFTNLAASYA
ncbi:Inosine-uridine nucleoside N-ribohydrolase [Mycolicibacterium chubuense NBB4]|uniref:Inosine-uridine nucleoside N-ribohydrolase n=1 Tax=Mycolicibacterium chubuense (strain NBB4) TaxID=710421 RepID=I4BD58_MYCCN|nr:nucleoside hydrolase [Mycolicibacterium chubuense]AFM15215.1 Inosine-uridine nucleoside N-ribohydrolase [Mycolicibacterium chubuense NBB4]